MPGKAPKFNIIKFTPCFSGLFGMLYRKVDFSNFFFKTILKY